MLERIIACLNVTPRRGLQLFALLLLVIAAALALSLWRGAQIETNVMALLPPAERDPVVANAVQRFSGELSRRHLLLVGADDFDSARNGAEQLAALLCGSGQFSEVTLRVDGNAAGGNPGNTAQFYRHHQPHLLTPAMRSALQSGGADAAVERALRLLYNPATPISSALLAHDPLLLFYDFMASQRGSAGNLQLRDGVLTAQHDNRHYVLLQLQLDDDPFSIALQQRVVPALDAALAQLRQQQPELALLDIGAVRYARAGVEAAQREVSSIGLLSLLGIIALILLVFRSPLPLLASLLPLAVGAAAALASCWLLFGSVHLLTLVFGTSLLGIAVDYSMHFFCDRLAGGKEWNARGAMQRILPAVVLGVLTTVVGYAGLFVSGFPAMQQLAVFSTVGVSAATLCVIWLYPSWVRTPERRRDPRWLRLAERLLLLLRPRPAPLWRTALWLLPLLCAVAFGLLRLQSNDDIRLLQNTPVELRTTEAELRTITGVNATGQFLLVRGDSPEQLLQREEQLLPALAKLQQQQALAGFDALSLHVPSAATQRANGQQVNALLQQREVLRRYADDVGLDPALFDQYAERVARSAAEPPLNVDNWLATDAGRAQAPLWLGVVDHSSTAMVHASLISLQGVTDSAALRALASGASDIVYVDQVADLSDLFGRYRERTLWLIALGYGAILALLIWRYGWRRGTAVMLPTALAALLTIAGLGWFGEQLNLFHLLALLLVLGIGVDYALFLVEAGDHTAATMLTIVLSALSTELSFGLLALSDTAAVRAFGLTVFIGVAGSMLLAPLVLGRATPVNNLLGTDRLKP